jgi:DnaJ family protein C protein 9
LGVWDEFYGSGKKTKKEKGKRKDGGEAEADEDHSALQALIKKKQKNMDSFFDGLAAKYSEPSPKDSSRIKGKKRRNDSVEDDKPSRKKSRSNVPPAPEIDEEEFAKLQEKLFGDKATPASEGRKGKGKRAK